MARFLRSLRELARLADVRLPRPVGAVVSRLAETTVAHQVRSTLAVRLTGAALCTAGVSFIGVGTLGAPTAAGPLALVANQGDVWVNNVNDAATAGHENDPHLACANINVMGDALASSTGTFTVIGWPPSGTANAATDQAWPTSGAATWNYNTTAGGNQVVATIDVGTLIANAVNNGDTAQLNQGFHFKLSVVQDPTKFKVFWVNCAGAPGSPGSPGAPGSPGSSSSPGSTSSFAPTTGVQGATAPTPAVGADPAFGWGIVLLVGGGSLVVFAKRITTRRKD